MREKVEQTILILTAIFSVFLSLLDMFGLLEGVTFLSNKISTLTLLAIGLVLAYLIIEKRSKLDNIENLLTDSTEKIFASLSGINIQRFSDSKSIYEYVIKRMKEAKTSIDDLTWGKSEPEKTIAEQKAFEKYLDTISTVCSKKNIIYREVMSFPPPQHLKRAEQMLSKNLYSYHLRYYNFGTEEIPPLLSFMVLDSEEVILAGYRSTFLPSEREVRIAIKHPEIVTLFQDYYDTIWHAAKVLKEGNNINHSLLEELHANFAD